MKPGDKVVDLAACAATAGLVGGAVTAVLALRPASPPTWLLLVALVGAGFLGRYVGAAVGRFFFPARAGHVTVVRAGPGALPATLKGNLAAALFAALAVGGLLALSGRAAFAPVAAPCLGASASLGALLALLASLL